MVYRVYLARFSLLNTSADSIMANDPPTTVPTTDGNNNNFHRHMGGWFTPSSGHQLVLRVPSAGAVIQAKCQFIYWLYGLASHWMKLGVEPSQSDCKSDILATTRSAQHRQQSQLNKWQQSHGDSRLKQSMLVSRDETIASVRVQWSRYLKQNSSQNNRDFKQFGARQN